MTFDKAVERKKYTTGIDVNVQAWQTNSELHKHWTPSFSDVEEKNKGKNLLLEVGKGSLDNVYCYQQMIAVLKIKFWKAVMVASKQSY